jgi:hypothetical protein
MAIVWGDLLRRASGLRSLDAYFYLALPLRYVLLSLGCYLALKDYPWYRGDRSDPKALAVLPDGRILAAGEFMITNLTDGQRHVVIRMQPDGSVDNSFRLVSDEGEAHCLAIQSDGSILVGGNFTRILGPEPSAYQEV